MNHPSSSNIVQTKSGNGQENSDEINTQIHVSINGIKNLWDSICPNDILFSSAYLEVIERFPPDNLQMNYGLVYQGQDLVGLVYFQSKKINLKNHLRLADKKSKIRNKLKSLVANSVRFYCTVCGNTLLTGPYGFHFIESFDKKNIENALINAIHSFNDFLKSENITPGITLIKDFFLSQNLPIQTDQSGFVQFEVQPKMIAQIQDHWHSYNDYLADTKSKYRVRNNKARSLAEGIQKIEFSHEDILQHENTIHVLYKNISDTAGFNAFVLHLKYFSELKKELGNNLIFTTYWKDGKMIAFFTSIINGQTLDAHFLGYDLTLNTKYHLYLNMLLDLMVYAIERRMKLLDLSRTAIEIKSTIGAIPQEMTLFLRHENCVVNSLTKSILGYVKPNEDYIIRNPFKDEIVKN